MPSDRIVTTGDLALLLGGSEGSFTGDLLRLVEGADPENRERLRTAFPVQVRAWELWQESFEPTGVQIMSLLAKNLPPAAPFEPTREQWTLKADAILAMMNMIPPNRADWAEFLAGCLSSVYRQGTRHEPIPADDGQVPA